jgi:flagellar biosynthesis protein FliR
MARIIAAINAIVAVLIVLSFATNEYLINAIVESAVRAHGGPYTDTAAITNIATAMCTFAGIAVASTICGTIHLIYRIEANLRRLVRDGAHNNLPPAS